MKEKQTRRKPRNEYFTQIVKDLRCNITSSSSSGIEESFLSERKEKLHAATMKQSTQIIGNNKYTNYWQQQMMMMMTMMLTLCGV